MAKVLVSIDKRLLDRIDNAAKARGLSRSAYIAQLAARDIDGRSGPGTDPAVHRALALLDELFASALAGDATLELRAERDAR